MLDFVLSTVAKILKTIQLDWQISLPCVLQTQVESIRYESSLLTCISPFNNRRWRKYIWYFTMHPAEFKATVLHFSARITMKTQQASPPPSLMRWDIILACPTILNVVCVVRLTAVGTVWWQRSSGKKHPLGLFCCSFNAHIYAHIFLVRLSCKTFSWFVFVCLGEYFSYNIMNIQFAQTYVAKSM